ncbi:hypothetical protein J4456_03600 [Candidatus Pacearchaeota archaeon]|nr:hypothetical protein [Candidatus Pacearchaeota archaeon]
MTDKYNFLDYAELNSEQKGLIKNLARALDAYPIKCIYEDWDTILLTAWENNTPRGYIEYTTSNNGPGIVLDTIGCLPNNYFLRTYDKTMAEEIFDLMLFHNLKREYVRVEEVTNTGNSDKK